MQNFSIIIFIALILRSAFASEIEVKSLNSRFMWIKVPSRYVQARLNNPVDGLAICHIKAHTPSGTFEFITRRAKLYDECFLLVMGARKIINESETVEIIGSSASKDGNNTYSAMFDLIRNSKNCQGYFGDCENFEKRSLDWQDSKSKVTDPKMYP